MQFMDAIVERTETLNSAPVMGLVTRNARPALVAPEHTRRAVAETGTTAVGASTSTLAAAVLLRFAPQVPSAA